MNDKVALVTGGTSGIGKEIVLELLNKGCKVATCYSKNENNANSLKKEANTDNLLVMKCDVTDENSVINMLKEIKEKVGNIDFLVNNAGMIMNSSIKNFDIDQFKQVLNLNLIGKVICTKNAYNYMNDCGAIVNISSHVGITPCKDTSAYCAAAAGIINFTKASALEFAERKIRVNCICPSFTLTPLALNFWSQKDIDDKLKKTPLGRLATPEDTAKLCLYLLSDEASFITGENICINGGRF